MDHAGHSFDPDCYGCATALAQEQRIEELEGTLHRCPDCGEACKGCQCYEKRLHAAESRLTAAEGLLREAIQDEGPNPEHHRETMARHRREWPTLWRAIDAFLSPKPDEDER